MDVRRASSRLLAALRVPQVIPLTGFLLVILVGSALLWMPWSHRAGAVGYLDALFTSTSAVCVTGLTAVSTADDFSVAGQVVILLLIQIGGLGVMTYAAMALTLLGRRMSLRAQAALHDSLFQGDEARDFRHRFWQIVGLTFILEALGTLILFLALLGDGGNGPAAWSAVFHSVSAFCNAGFSILPHNLVDLRSDHLFMAVMAILVVLGGLGFTVLHEVAGEAKRVLTRQERQQPRRFSLHTSVVLRTSLVLVVGGAAAVLLFGLTSGEGSWGDRVAGAFFQSVSSRTAGFNSVNIGALPVATLLVLTLLMFIGGSPGSCAGGVKTSTFAVLFAKARGYLTGHEDVRLMGRTVNRDLVRNVGLLLVLAVLWNMLGLLLLTYFERGRPDVGLHNLLFEQISAFATVGLSTDATTAGLSAGGKIWIIATMYVGRLGPLTLASLALRRKTARVSFPEGKVMIG